MCGLIAALTADAPLSDQRMATSLATIAHRGPDNTAWWFSSDRRLALGHVRLRIIGLEHGDQPIANAAGDLRCVVNGEFYGYRAIRDALRAAGREMLTDTDSEIVLHLYEQLGVECVHQLRGEFALVIADERRGRLIAIRDRFGIKPLFYAIHQGAVYFASEIKALLALGVPARWDREAYFAECHTVRPPDRTLFAGIFSVPPGCLAIARDGRVEIHNYWDIEFPTKDALIADRRGEQDIVAGFRDVLEDAVAERMVADVEIACYLSGGIDSCAVLGLARRRTSRPIRAFSIVFDDDVYDEGRLAEQAAALADADLVPVPISQAQLADAFSDTLWHNETPMLNAHSVAKYLLSRAVRDAGIKVVLTGEGADEILAGYPPFRRDMILHNSTGMDEAEAAGLLAELAAANQSSRGLLSTEGAVAPGLKTLKARLGWVPSALESFSSLAAKIYPLFNDEYLAAGLRADPYADMLDGLDLRRRLLGRDPVNQALYLWSRLQLPNYVLTVLADRVEMAHSVEGRVPFLDHAVAEYAASLPISYKIRGLREKYVLREAVRDCVPKAVYDRQKHPFMTPPARTVEDPLALYCRDVLQSAAVDRQPFFDPRKVRQLMDQMAQLPPADQAASEGAVLRVVSTCVLQERFALAS